MPVTVNSREQLMGLLASSRPVYGITRKPTYISYAASKKEVSDKYVSVIKYTNKCGCIPLVGMALGLLSCGLVLVFGVAAGGSHRDTIVATILASCPVLYILANLVIRSCRRQIVVDVSQSVVLLSVKYFGLRVRSDQFQLYDVVGYEFSACVVGSNDRMQIVALEACRGDFIGYIPASLLSPTIRSEIQLHSRLNMLLFVGPYQNSNVFLIRNI